MKEVKKRAAAITLAVSAALTALGGAAWAQEDRTPPVPDLASALRSAPDASAGGMGPSMKVVAGGLDNPRGIALAPNGALFVAESGAGGSECFDGGIEGRACYGRTGAITRVKNGEQGRVVRGLPSFAAEDGSAASGPNDVSFSGRGEKRKLFVAVGEGSRKKTGDGRFSRLLRVKSSGTAGVADLLAYERRNNPDGTIDPSTGKPELNSNPFSTFALKNGSHAVADAGANALLRISAGGDIRTRAVFPSRLLENPGQYGLPPGFRYQSVPNSIARGPGASYYVGELTGFPFPVGKARVYKVVPGSATPRVYARGFTNIVDVARGPDGSLYVLEIAKNSLLSNDPTGRLVRVYPNDRQKTVASKGLVTPSGLAIGRNGEIYVSNFGLAPDGGQVVRIKQ